MNHLHRYNKNKTKIDKYFVVTVFNKTRAAATWHGHSAVYFYNKKYKIAASVYVAMPYNLPYKLSHNHFYFKQNINGTKKEFVYQIQTPLPNIFSAA